MLKVLVVIQYSRLTNLAIGDSLSHYYQKMLFIDTTRLRDGGMDI